MVYALSDYRVIAHCAVNIVNTRLCPQALGASPHTNLACMKQARTSHQHSIVGQVIFKVPYQVLSVANDL